MSLTVYGFEDKHGNESGSYTTMDSDEARRHAQQYGLRVVAMEYEYDHSDVLWEWDFTEVDEPEEAKA